MTLQAGDVILRFTDVSFSFSHNKPILDEVRFSVRRGTKITLMGQNGAGKSTILQLITKNLKPEAGTVAIERGSTIGTARQVITRGEMDLTVQEFFQGVFVEKVYDIEPRIKNTL